MKLCILKMPKLVCSKNLEKSLNQKIMTLISLIILRKLEKNHFRGHFDDSRLMGGLKSKLAKNLYFYFS